MVVWLLFAALLLPSACRGAARTVDTSAWSPQKLEHDSGADPGGLARWSDSLDAEATSASSFWELEQAVGSDASVISITSTELLFPRQLEMTSVQLIKGTVAGATLSGGNSTRLFFLHDGSKMNLRDLSLAHGQCVRRASECIGGNRGGAIFVSATAELSLISVRITDSAANAGGAIFATGATVSMTDCVATFNSASNCGGAVYAERHSTVTTTNCVLSSNSAGDSGGAIYSSDSTIISTNCVIATNSATFGAAVFTQVNSIIVMQNCMIASNSAVDGGALCTRFMSFLNMTGCALISNTATYQGGAITALDYSTVIATNCTMTSNSAFFRGSTSVDTIGGSVCAMDHSTVVITRCALTSNYAVYGGAISATSWAMVEVSDSTLTSNTARESGGAIYLSDYATVVVSCGTLTSNTAGLRGGGGVSTFGSSIFTATNCSVSSNSGYWGGAIATFDASIATTTDCTMTSNSAYSGAAVYVSDDSDVILTGSAMMSNRAVYGGGAVFTTGWSALTAANCFMASHDAYVGGAVAAFGGSSVVLSEATFHSNFAHWGGAVLAAGEFTAVTTISCALHANSGVNGGAISLQGRSRATAIGCYMTMNSAHYGGAVFVQSKCTLVLTTSTMTSNSAARSGGALYIKWNASVILASSLFESNVVSNATVDDDGVGITSMGGRVQCASAECLPICTVCQDDDGFRPPPDVEPQSTSQATWNTFWSLAGIPSIVVGLSVGFLVLFAGTAVRLYQRRRRPEIPFVEEEEDEDFSVNHQHHQNRQRAEWPPATGIQLGETNSTPLLLVDERAIGHDDASSHRPGTSGHDDASSRRTRASYQDSEDQQSHTSEVMLTRSTMAMSPAPIFVLDQNLRITVWSKGLARAAPLLGDPVGGLLSELPFVNQKAASQFCGVVRRIFDLPDEWANESSILYLQSQNGPVLLEMAATIMGTNVVMAGQVIEADLAGLISCKAFDRKEDQDGRSNVSSLTMPTFQETSTYTADDTMSNVSPLSAPTLFQGFAFERSLMNEPRNK